MPFPRLPVVEVRLKWFIRRHKTIADAAVARYFLDCSSSWLAAAAAAGNRLSHRAIDTAITTDTIRARDATTLEITRVLAIFLHIAGFIKNRWNVLNTLLLCDYPSENISSQFTFCKVVCSHCCRNSTAYDITTHSQRTNENKWVFQQIMQPWWLTRYAAFPAISRLLSSLDCFASKACRFYCC